MIIIKKYMIVVYGMAIKNGSRTLETIPAEYVEYVLQYLETGTLPQ